MIDADFIAQYQISYGSGQSTGETQEMTEEEKQAKEEEYWRNYYSVYSQQQPALPKFDEEGNPIEEEEEESDSTKDKKKKKKTEKTDESTDSPDASQSEATVDPTSEEHYQYNLYYYGKEYADAYRDYYRDNPDGEAMPDWINMKNAASGQDQTKKDQDAGKKGKKKAEKRKEPPREQGWFETDTDKSTQLYVSGLPSDITEEEYQELMAKCGLIMFDPFTRKPKLKLYKDSEGNVKGDGLCTYIKPESVALALDILDGFDLRGHTITVEKAKFEMKGTFDPSKKKKKLSNKQKQKLKERQQKLFDWRPDKNPFERSKHERNVILKNMFDIREFEENPALINELRLDVREECLKFGEVKKVTLYDRHPEGVISVLYKEPEEADACIAALNGRWFAKRRIMAAAHDGKTKYDITETDEERAKRLQDWEKFLSGESKATSSTAPDKAEEKAEPTVEEREGGGREAVGEGGAACASSGSESSRDSNGAASGPDSR